LFVCLFFFKKYLTQRPAQAAVSAIAVTNKKGELIGNISVSDLKDIGALPFQLTVSENQRQF
jgi:hypothetical protein